MKKHKLGKLMLGLLITILAAIIVGCSSGGNEKTSSGDNDENKNNNQSDVTLKLLGSGGLTEESIEEGYVKPLTERTGIKVIQETPNEFGKIEAMIKSGQNTYNILAIDGGTHLYLAEQMGLIEKIDWERISEPLLEDAKKPSGFGFQFVSNVMAWRKDAKPIETWTDFWDVEKFPGKRAMLDDPTVILPIALLADGVPKDELFPLDLDRAFKSVEKIAPHVSVWWTTGAQPIQLLTDGEVDYATAWSGRTYGNEDLDFTYNEALLDIGYFAIPKGAKNIDEIYEFLNEASRPKNQAIAAEIIPYTGPSPNLSEYLPKEVMAQLPSSHENYESQFTNDPEYFHKHRDEINERWQEFKLGLN